MNREEKNKENVNQKTEAINQEATNQEAANQEATNQGITNQKVMMKEDKKRDMLNLTMGGDKEVSSDDRNVKERMYDKIPISLKALDILIGVLIAMLIIILLYFIIRRFS